MSEYSSQDVALYVNAINRTMARNGVTKVITDDFWKDEIVPILFPVWDSDKDKLESFIRYKTGSSLMNKNKFQRNQKTGDYKWVSYEFNLDAFDQSEIDDLYNKLEAKYTEFRDLNDITLEGKLAAQFAADEYVNWTKITIVRNFLLMDSDWTQVADSPLTDDEKAQWVTYRQKLRDLPQEHQSIPVNDVKFPISPKKYTEMLAANSELGAYLSSDDQFFIIGQSVYRKFASRAMTYMAMAITTKQVDGMPHNRVFSESNTLDAILRAIDDGGLG
tara:strand:- start:790 stop:1614 length:825 start_codon:yes stop_codon:yes gene_type:complete